MDFESRTLPIRALAEEDRPREKLLSRGTQSLTDTELVAILLATGTAKRSAIDLARELLKTFGGIENLARAGLHDLKKIHGIGNAKALTLISAFELNRRKTISSSKPNRILGSAEAAAFIKPLLEDLPHEVFHVLFMNRNNQVIENRRMFSGGVSATVVDIKMIFRDAANLLASGIIVAHNHPSGNLEPSQSDLDLTRKIYAAGKVIEIDLLDHIIVSNQGYYSFADNGRLDG